jgi:thiosulfate/3-mercaptopyruvate sulfurtransferase
MLRAKTKLLPFLTLLMVSTSLPLNAEDTGPVVSAAWLAQHLHDPDMVVLHIGDHKNFLQGHIPGARQVETHADLSNPSSHSGNALILELPAPAQLEHTLESLGVSDHSRLVLYWSGNDITNATRALFTLDWAGLGKQSYFLDGGLDAWKRANYEVSTETESTPAVKPGSLTLKIKDELVVDADWIQSHKDNANIRLIDARPKAFYDGVSQYHPVAGHIPSAGSAPWTDFIDADIRLQDKETLQAILTKAGVNPDDTVVAYCHIGQFATMAILAARVLGHEVKLYDGAFQDWAARGLPATTIAQE